MLRAAEQIARYGWLTNRPVTAATNYTELAALNDLRTSGPTTEQDDYMHAALALSATLLAAPAPPGLLLRDRIVETVIGAAVGIAVVTAPAAWRRLRAPADAGRVAA